MRNNTLIVWVCWQSFEWNCSYLPACHARSFCCIFFVLITITSINLPSSVYHHLSTIIHLPSSLYLSISLSFYLSILLSILLSIHLSIYLSDLSIWSIYLIYLSDLSIWSIYLSIWSIYLSTYLSIYLPITSLPFYLSAYWPATCGNWSQGLWPPDHPWINWGPSCLQPVGLNLRVSGPQITHEITHGLFEGPLPHAMALHIAAPNQEQSHLIPSAPFSIPPSCHPLHMLLHPMSATCGK